MTDNGLDLRAVKTFPSLVKYLRDELDWPIESDDVEDLTFDYEPEELGLDAKTAVKIKEIKQLRPLASNQPWGIFFINFEPKQLPIVALRRILRALVFKKRASGSRAQQKTWQLNDLLFISSYGDSSERAITLAHFSEDSQFGDLPTLRVLGWDAQDTVLHLEDAEQTLKTKLHWPDNTADVEFWRSTWSSAFTLRPREVVRTSRELAVKLADLATVIRERANKVLAIESASGPFRKLHQAFQEALIHDLSQDDFADMYAQTIAYGLLTARVSRPAGLVAENIVDIVPNTNPFLKELLGTFLRVGGRKGKIDFDELGINEVVELLRNADMDAVLRDFGDRNPNEDPVIHFYELFLKEYDANKRMQRGVFYTPRPVVSYIVRSVDELLRAEFGLKDGLADTTTWSEMAKRHKDLKVPEGTSPDQAFVQILDPATGTGTFLVEVIDIIHKTMAAEWQAQGQGEREIASLWNEYVPKNLLPRLHAYELLMAPYAIAHLKVGLKLYETGYRFGSNERARIYLTNALEPARDFSGTFEFAIPALAHEAQAVNQIKSKQRFTVVIGNPPYATFGQLNKVPFILNLLAGYKRGLDERNVMLHDDYIKFVCFSQYQVDLTGAGIVGMITNNSFLDGATHRRMRESLLESYSSIQVVNLHGSLKKGETAPDGSKDENVFDITVGVGISVFVKGGQHRGVMGADIWGRRSSKYDRLWKGKPQLIALPAPAPEFFFVPKNVSFADEYRISPSIPEMFLSGASAIKTHRDELVVDYSRERLEQRFQEIARSNDVEALKAKFGIVDTAYWTLGGAKRHIHEKTVSRKVRNYLYRPFDLRYVFYEPDIIERSRWEVMQHMLQPNLALVCTRQTNPGNFTEILATNALIDKRALASFTGEARAYPLYTYDEISSFDLVKRDVVDAAPNNRRPNLSPKFLRNLAERLGLPQKDAHGLTPEEIFHYAYAVFHSPGYRSRYAEFLKIDFPRLPLTDDPKLFRALARLGGELSALHLMESPKLDRIITRYTGPRNPEVGRVGWSDNTVWLDAVATKKGQTATPGTIGFRGLPETVWNFHIGGYQVCEKWLKDRRGRTLSDEDITHYQRIVVALNETIRLMGEIDAVIEEHGGWPLVGSQDAPKPSNPDQLPFS
jgi:predicted helicase